VAALEVGRRQRRWIRAVSLAVAIGS